MGNQKPKSKEKKTGKAQWFFLIIFVPLLFAVILGGVILSFLGINVLELGREAVSNVPGLAEMVEEEGPNEETEQLESAEEAAAKDDEIAALQAELEAKDDEIRDLETELEEVLIESETDQNQSEDEDGDDSELTDIYENMAPGSAADVFSEMDTARVVLHMNGLRADTRSQILAKMEPADAASILSALENN
ncbi:MotE family protein [Alteribacillus sp. HJP-4]|uniref:MotE family protein n=1 Tax=Alteribacillus sp. HJP-4 TaxID=2775394 RepID=UPI0035CD1549